MNENILYNPRVRTKTKRGFWKRLFDSKPYYELEEITLKEKIYTYHFILQTTGFTTKGEASFMARMDVINSEVVKEIEDEFKKDFMEYSQNPDKK